MQELTQDFFREAPDWVDSAAADASGAGYWYSCGKSELFIVDDWWDWPQSNNSLYVREVDIIDWKNSAIDRKGYRCPDCGYFHVPHQCRECECINCHNLIT